jgi:hypothetical protein
VHKFCEKLSPKNDKIAVFLEHPVSLTCEVKKYLFGKAVVKNSTAGTIQMPKTKAREKLIKLSAPINKATSKYKKNFVMTQDDGELLKSHDQVKLFT